MIELIGYDANGTDGTDPALVTAIYRVAGHRVEVPANYTMTQVRNYIKTRYTLNDAQLTQLEELQTAFQSLDFSTITTLTDTAITPELVAAIQTLGQALRHTVAMLKFTLQSD